MSKPAMLPDSTKPSPTSVPPPANSASSAATLPLPANLEATSVFDLYQNKKGQPLRWPFFSLLRCVFASLHHSSAVAAFGIAHSSGHAVLHPAQTPSQPLRQLVSRAPQPRL